MESPVTHKVYGVSTPREPSLLQCLQAFIRRWLSSTAPDNFAQLKCCSKIDHVQDLKFGTTHVNNLKNINSQTMVERIVVGECSLVCWFLVGCFFACWATVKLHCIYELLTDPSGTKQVDHRLPRHMSKLAMQSPDGDSHPGWKLPPLASSFDLILRKSWNLNFIKEGILRNEFLNRIHLGSITRVPQGIKRFTIIPYFIFHITHKSYSHLVVQFTLLGPVSNPVCKLPRQNVIHGLSTKPRFKIL